METLEKNEFLAFLFLYAAAADQVLTRTEVELIAEKVGKNKIKKAKSQFDNLSDYERIEYILAHKQEYFPNEEQKTALLNELKEIFLADNVFSVQEQNLFRALNRLM